jgi:hypothetical protein
MRYQPPPVPAHIAKSDASATLNVRIPAGMHWQLKMATTALETNMSEVVIHLLPVFLRDPESVMKMAARAQQHGITLGDLIHAELADPAGTET